MEKKTGFNNIPNWTNILLVLFTGVSVFFTSKSVKLSYQSLQISKDALSLTQRSMSSSDSISKINIELVSKTSQANQDLAKSFEQNLALSQMALQIQINENKLYHLTQIKEGTPSIEFRYIDILETGNRKMKVVFGFNCFCKYDVDIDCADINIKLIKKEDIVSVLNSAYKWESCDERNSIFSKYANNTLSDVYMEYPTAELWDSLYRKEIFMLIYGRVFYNDKVSFAPRAYDFYAILELIDNPNESIHPTFAFKPISNINYNRTSTEIYPVSPVIFPERRIR